MTAREAGRARTFEWIEGSPLPRVEQLFVRGETLFRVRSRKLPSRLTRVLCRVTWCRWQDLPVEADRVAFADAAMTLSTDPDPAGAVAAFDAL